MSANNPPEAQAMPLSGHLIELRTRLIWVICAMLIGTTISFIFVDEIYSFLIEPLAKSMTENDTNRLIYTGLTEAFFTYLKVAFFAGMFLTFPILLIQIWIFVAPGLYKNEKKVFFPFLVATPALFFLGGACVYYFVLPMAWPFFLSFLDPVLAEVTVPEGEKLPHHVDRGVLGDGDQDHVVGPPTRFAGGTGDSFLHGFVSISKTGRGFAGRTTLSRLLGALLVLRTGCGIHAHM